MTKTIKLIPSDVKFSVKKGETLLSAALRQQIPLSHSCKTGRCNSCQAIAVENGQEKVVLTCQYQPVSDVDLIADYFPQLVGIEEKLIPCKVTDYQLINDHVLVLYLRTPPNQPLNYLAGQYIDLSLDGVSRSYSLASLPCDGQLELHIKRVEHGVMSHQLLTQIRQNLLMRLHGPKGTFFIRDLNHSGPIVFLATGTGFAPVKAMLKQLFLEHYTGDIYLFWGNRHLSDVYDESPQQWQAFNPNFHYVPVVSQESALQPAVQGYVQQVAVQQLHDFSSAHVYACGSANMIASAAKLLVQHGLAVTHFYSDAFVASTN
ncbi:FAD-binding oxidoreductase [Celerinatantimonas yamalensis]|uniref:FAD-binding oxidoreductase n=1 Tax=Celerinatantimonas yamalensis TaxID=559956 RepID=A0ABW9G4E6_9GAMM